jgi:hypothetical protein
MHFNAHQYTLTAIQCPADLHKTQDEATNELIENYQILSKFF